MPKTKKRRQVKNPIVDGTTTGATKKKVFSLLPVLSLPYLSKEEKEIRSIFFTRTDKFQIMLKNCTYRGCDMKNKWMVEKHGKSKDGIEMCFIRAECCKYFRSGLWVNTEDLHQLKFLIEKLKMAMSVNGL